jgi:integrase
MRGHIRERSPGRWSIVIDVADPQTGKRRRKWHSFAGNKRQAQVECARLISEIGQGRYVERTKIAVGDFVCARIEQWEAAGDITARSAERYRLLASRQIGPHIGAKLLQKLSRLDIEGWHTALRNSGLTARTIGHAHRVLGKALADAERDGMLMKNACKVQRAPRVSAQETTIVTDIPGLIEKLRGEPLYALAMTALFTGMRLGELLALRERYVDLDRGVIEIKEALEETAAHGVRFKPTKTAAGKRTITLPEIAIKTLREHRRELLERRMLLGLGKLNPDDLLFGNMEGKPARTTNTSASWAALAERIGMPEITFHALRHTHASQLIARGVDIVTISKRLGHANPGITLKVYAHLFATDDSKAAAAINSAFGSVGGR